MFCETPKNEIQKIYCQILFDVEIYRQFQEELEQARKNLAHTPALDKRPLKNAVTEAEAKLAAIAQKISEDQRLLEAQKRRI